MDIITYTLLNKKIIDNINDKKLDLTIEGTPGINNNHVSLIIPNNDAELLQTWLEENTFKLGLVTIDVEFNNSSFAEFTKMHSSCEIINYNDWDFKINVGDEEPTWLQLTQKNLIFNYMGNSPTVSPTIEGHGVTIENCIALGILDLSEGTPTPINIISLYIGESFTNLINLISKVTLQIHLEGIEEEE